MSDLEERLRQQLPALASEMVESHAAADQPGTGIWPQRASKTRRGVRLAAAAVVVLALAATGAEVLLNQAPNVVTTTPVPPTPAPDTHAATPAQSDAESTPTTEPPTPTGPTTDPASSTDSPCTDSIVVEQSLGDLVADCEALWAFYMNQDSKGGLGDDPDTAWSHTNPLQNWLGVTVTEGRVAHLRLTILDIPAVNLSAQLGNLTGLRELNLSKMQLSDMIPDSLRGLTNLEVLVLVGPAEGGTKLRGPIPAWLGDLTSLKCLNLADNELSGPIPPELVNLVNLDLLDLSGNELSGPTPDELSDLSSDHEDAHRFDENGGLVCNGSLK